MLAARLVGDQAFRSRSARSHIARDVDDKAALRCNVVFLFRLTLIGRHFERHDQFLRRFGLISLLRLLLLLDQLVLNQSLNLVWVVLGDISDAFATGSDEALEREVVAGGERVVLVGFDVAARVFSRALVELVKVQHLLELLKVDRDGILTNDDAWVILNALDLLKPNMSADIGCGKPLCWVSVEDLRDQVAAVVADEIRDAVVRVQYLLVKHIGLGVFKGQVATDHRVQDNAA